MGLLKTAWAEIVRPLIQRPNHVQVAAICYRGTGPDRDVLMITSRDTGRWIIPKGWPIDGLNESQAAAQEAWEEAGAKLESGHGKPMGSYSYEKRLDGGNSITCETLVYGFEVKDLHDTYPEQDDRTRKWVPPHEAAKMVNEPELKAILEAM